MKQKIILLFIITISATLTSCVNQERQKTKDSKFKLNAEDVSIVIPELHSISELKTIFEAADMRFDPEIINQQEFVSLYLGDKKIAANIGVYLADLVYVMTTKENPDIQKEYGAVFELAKQYGIADGLLNLTFERYENGNVSMDGFFKLLEESLENSSNNMSESEVSEFNSYLILGNYIEKLYIVSSLLQQKNDKVNPATEAEMKRGLLHLISNQSIRINQLIYVMSKYPNNSTDVLVLEDLELLFSNYLDVEANRDEILKLEAVELLKLEEVTTVFKQIEKIRNRMVLL